jgi:amino acid transporter
VARKFKRLGTFAGVFTPSVLTILGLILFRRLGFVVGAAGTADVLLIIVFANLISILTSTSLSAIATNMHVKSGGDYYLISRSLGAEFGGALGIVLFLAQAISVAFYCIGFAEGLTAILPETWPLLGTVLAAAAVLFLFIFAWLGSDWATRLQYVVMTALVAALASFFLGGALHFSSDTLQANWAQGASDGLDFWILFALFFPAVTGFTQGVSMSGDLADPGRSLPVGTFSAIGVSFVVYVVAALLLAGSLSNAELVTGYDSMDRVAAFQPLITLGVVAATLSSGLASFLGAPRILQALAADRVFPLLSPLAHGHGPANNPRRAVLLTLAIALFVVSLGGINLIAPIVSMFFLISYGLLNYATALEARAQSPSFRPRFRWFHYRTSLAGAALCLGVMLMISPWASAVALALLFVLYQYVQRLAPPHRWADSRRDHHFHEVRTHLLAMDKEPLHPRNWRAHLLVFSDEPRRRAALVEFATSIEGGAGLTTVVRILEGSGEQIISACRDEQKQLQADIDAHGPRAFALVVAGPSIETAAATLIQSYGIGPIRANTILLNWLEEQPDGGAATDDHSERLFVRTLRAAARLGMNIVVLDAKEQPWERAQNTMSRDRRIDVWFTDDRTGHLMLLLSHMITRNDDWHGTAIRLLVRTSEGAREETAAHTRELLDDARIDAEVVPIVASDYHDVVARSEDASLVFLPLRLLQMRIVDPFGKPIVPLLEALPVVALAAAIEDIDLDAGPEDAEPPS